jgi:hypothetical protein
MVTSVMASPVMLRVGLPWPSKVISSEMEPTEPEYRSRSDFTG